MTKKFEDFKRALDSLCVEHDVDLSIDNDREFDHALVVAPFERSPYRNNQTNERVHFKDELKD